MYKRGDIKVGVTPPETQDKAASEDALEAHPTTRLAAVAEKRATAHRTKPPKEPDVLPDRPVLQ